MTDKATVELPSPVGGTIARLGAEAGDVVAVGSDLVWIETDGDDGADAGRDERAPAPRQDDRRRRSERRSRRIRRSTSPGDRRRRARRAGTATGGAARPRRRCAAAPPTSASISAAVAGIGPRRPGRPRRPRPAARRASDAAPAAPARVAAPQAGDDDVEAVKVIGLRRNIAQRMQESTRRIPHFTYVEEVDVTDVERLRARAQPPARGTPGRGSRCCPS